MGADEVTALLGKETSTVPTTQASDDTVKVWGDPESDTVVARVSFHGGKVTGKAIASRDLATAEKDIKALGDKYGPGDQAIFNAARANLGAGWLVADEIVREASPEMQAAYRKWRDAATALQEQLSQ
jgi:hypothetical protein